MEFKQREKRQHREQQEQQEQETQAVEVDEQAAQVSEDAACCLADIDAVLADCDKERELTDEEILEKGAPDAEDYGYDFWDRWAYGDYDGYWTARDRYYRAYERVYGVSIDSCTC